MSSNAWSRSRYLLMLSRALLASARGNRVQSDAKTVSIRIDGDAKPAVEMMDKRVGHSATNRRDQGRRADEPDLCSGPVIDLR